MRKINVIKGDILFQWKYGFYLLYFILVVLYLAFFSYLDGEVKNAVVTICVLSDPAAMGLFFMGALILLEKSQRVTDAIAVSPVSPGEYIAGKVISIGMISLLAGLVLTHQGNLSRVLCSSIGILGGSVLFSLCGIIVGTKAENMNQYIVGTLPFEILGFIPAIAYRLGFQQDNPWMLIHPGCALVRLMDGNMEMMLLSVISVLTWCIIFFVPAYAAVKKMFCTTGKIKL